MAQGNPGVLVVDGDARSGEAIEAVLASASLSCRRCAAAEEALEAAADAAVGVVLLDLGVEDTGGGPLLGRLLALRPTLRVIVLSDAPDEDRVLEALRGGACDYLAKPIHEEELALAVQRAVEAYGIRTRFTRLRGRLERLAARLDELAARAAPLHGDDRATVVREGIVEAASEVLEAAKTSLLVRDADADVLRVAAWTGRRMKPGEIEPVPIGEGVAGVVFARREAWRVVDAAADERVPGVDRGGRYDTPSFVACPVGRGDGPFGVLCATDRATGGPFEDDDLGLLRLLARHAGEALGGPTAVELGPTAAGDDAAHAAAEGDDGDAVDADAELAREICEAATDELEAERVIQGALAPLSRRLPAAPVSIFLLDPEDGELRREGECDGGVAGDREQLAWGRGLTGHVLQTGQLVATADPAADRRFDAEVDTPLDGAARPYLCLPLKLRGKVVGVCRAFGVDGATPSARTAEVIAPVLSAAVRNALLYRSLVEAIEDVADARRAARG